MKKLGKGFKLMVIVCTMILLTGCVKYDMTMDITKEDVKVGLIYAMQSSYVTDSTMFDETKKEAKDEGYTVEDYKDDDYTGIKMYKSLGSLDSLSKGKGDVINITDLFSETNKLDKTKLFKLEKGVYKANFVFDATNENSLSGGSESSDEDDDLFSEDESSDDSYDEEESDATLEQEEDDEWSFDTESSSDESDNNDADLNKMLSGIKFKFEVTLPNAAVSNNATKVSDDKKTLTWEVSYGSKANVEFSFKTTNNMITYIAVGAVAVVVVAGVVILIVKKKGKGAKPNMAMPNQVGPMPMNNQTGQAPVNPTQPVNNNQPNPVNPNNQ